MTVIVSAMNAVTAQQSIAMAVPAVVLTVGGFTRMVIGDAWTAWRRGFRNGCEAGLEFRRGDGDFAADLTARSRREVRLAVPIRLTG